MLIRNVEINVGRTVNMGNYESLRLDVKYGAEVAPGENDEQVTRALYKKAHTQLAEFISYEIYGPPKPATAADDIPDIY